MASPQAAEASVSLNLNPHQNTRYTIKLSDRITNPSPSHSHYKTVKFNHKPKATGKVRTTTVKPTSMDDNQFNLSIRDKESAKSTKASTYEYTGQRRELKKTYVLLFDQASQTATLEPLEETYAFNLKSAPWEKDAAKLAEQYQQVRPRREKPDRQLDAANDDADDLFSDGSETPRSLNESMFGDGPSDEEPEEGNPFDFRNFLKDAEQSEGFASPYSQSGTPLRTTTTSSNTATATTTTTAPARSTPLQQSERPKAKQTLKPAPKPAVKQQQTSTAASRKRKSPDPEQPAAKPKDKATVSTTTSSATATATKPQPTPAIRLDRRASARPIDSALSTSAPAAALSTQSSSKTSSRTSREPTPDDEDDDDDDAFGGLEIDWGGSDKSAGGRGRPRRSIALAFEQGVTGDGPVSLRSAADSASPNSRLHTPSMRATTKHAPDVIEFGAGDEDEEDEDEDERPGHHLAHSHEQEVDEDEDEEQEDDDGYAEDDEDADGDVDPLTLGSPAADTLQQSNQQQQQQQVELGGGEEEEEDDDDDGGDNFEDDFEEQMAQALASAAEEDVVQHEESEEESEEE